MNTCSQTIFMCVFFCLSDTSQNWYFQNEEEGTSENKECLGEIQLKNLRSRNSKKG